LDNAGTASSVSQGGSPELEAQKRRAKVEQFRPEPWEANARAREEAMDGSPTATLRAYRRVYGRDPRPPS
jgi:hypothetical protein